MASIWETISFVARTISTRNQQNVWIELISDLFVLLAPLCKFFFKSSMNSHLTRFRGQRIRLHALSPHDLLLPPHALYLLHPRLCPRTRLRQSRFCFIRHSDHWRQLCRTNSANGSTIERRAYLHGWYRPSTIFHLYLPCSRSEVSS